MRLLGCLVVTLHLFSLFARCRTDEWFLSSRLSFIGLGYCQKGEVGWGGGGAPCCERGLMVGFEREVRFSPFRVGKETSGKYLFR